MTNLNPPSGGSAACERRFLVLKFRSCLALILFALTSVVCGCGSARDQGVPQDWQVIEVAGAFTFAVPPGVRESDEQGIDSVVGIWRDERIEIVYDYGWYSSPLTEFDAQVTQAHDGLLDGRTARFIETPQLIAVHVPVVSGQSRFTLVVRFAEAADRDLGKAVIASVRFLAKSGDEVPR